MGFSRLLKVTLFIYKSKKKCFNSLMKTRCITIKCMIAQETSLTLTDKHHIRSDQFCFHLKKKNKNNEGCMCSC